MYTLALPSSFGSLPGIFLLCRVVFLLCGALFFSVEHTWQMSKNYSSEKKVLDRERTKTTRQSRSVHIMGALYIGHGDRRKHLNIQFLAPLGCVSRSHEIEIHRSVQRPSACKSLCGIDYLSNCCRFSMF